MLTKAIAEYRTRAYGDAARGLEPAVLEIFESLTSDPGFANAIRMDRAQAGERVTDPEARERLDAATGAAFARQLEHQITEVYEEDFPDLPMASGGVIDLDTSIPDGAESFFYYLFSAASIARLSSSYSAGTSPGTTISAARVNGTVEWLENHYEHTIRDLRNASFAGIPLERMQQTAARRAHDELLSDIGLYGREDVGLPGLLTHANATVTVPAADGTGSSTYWSAKTNDQVLRDIALLIDTPGQVSLGMRETTDVFFSREEERLLVTRRIGAGDGTLTLMGFLRATYPGVRFNRLNQLAASWSGGRLTTNSALALVKDRRTLRLVYFPFRQDPPERKDRKIRVNCESGTGGVIAVEPQTIHRMDGVGAS